MSTTSTAGAVVLRLYDDALNGTSYDTVVDEVAHPDVIVHEPDGDRTGPDAIKSTIRLLHASFSNLQFQVHDLIEAADKVVVRWSMSAVHTAAFAGFAATGKHVEQRATVIYRVHEGTIREVWPQIDRLGMFRQLQPTPPTGQEHP